MAISCAPWRRPCWPKLAALMDDSEHDVLAYMTFPNQHRTKLHSTDEIDKLFRRELLSW
jgi:putative transposase